MNDQNGARAAGMVIPAPDDDQLAALSSRLIAPVQGEQNKLAIQWVLTHVVPQALQYPGETVRMWECDGPDGVGPLEQPGYAAFAALVPHDSDDSPTHLTFAAALAELLGQRVMLTHYDDRDGECCVLMTLSMQDALVRT